MFGGEAQLNWLPDLLSRPPWYVQAVGTRSRPQDGICRSSREADPQASNAMRLLKKDEQGNLILVQHEHDNVPPYAILSHTWGPDSEEVTYKDLVEGTGKDKAGYAKLDFCVKQSALHGLEYFWVDTCSIDKSSSAELTEAINSMFNWYHNAARCYVYLSDVSIAEHATDPQSSRKTWETAFRNSRWFTRGWTLQELLAPASVEFFSKEGHSLGDKKSMESTIHTVTSIAVEALSGKKRLTDFTVQERMAWATHRKTKRPEDKAYSLLGLFAVFMPLIYGEGEENAFERLREQINKSSRGKSSLLTFADDADGTKLSSTSRVRDPTDAVFDGSFPSRQ